MEGDECVTPDQIMSALSSEAPMTLPIGMYMVQNELTDGELCASVRSLNTKQRYAYEIVLKWCRNKVKKHGST